VPIDKVAPWCRVTSGAEIRLYEDLSAFALEAIAEGWLTECAVLGILDLVEDLVKSTLIRDQEETEE